MPAQNRKAPRSPKTKTDKIPRTWTPCQCFAVYSYDVPSNPEDDSSVPQAFAYNSCGEQTTSTFKQGHDAKLKSALQKCFRAGVDYARLDGSMMVMVDPLQVARERGWEHFLTPGKAKAPKKGRTTPKTSGETKETKIERIAAMKKAAKMVKDLGLVNDQGETLQVNHSNFEAILAGKYTTTVSDLSIGVGSRIKVTYRGKITPGMVTEVNGERAKVTFETGTGKPITRVVELASLVRS